jgi:hypothetical protein
VIISRLGFGPLKLECDRGDLQTGGGATAGTSELGSDDYQQEDQRLKPGRSNVGGGDR